MKKKSYTYILQCADGTLYTGWTNDLEKRLHAHNHGTASKYTRSRLPVRFIYIEEHKTKQEAMKKEYAIKQLTKKQKMELIHQAPLKEGIHYYAMTGTSSHDE